MTQKQKERLTAWCLNLFVTYRIDYFRGVVLVEIVEYLCAGGSQRLMRAIGMCQWTNNIGFEVNTKCDTELIKELQQIAKEVPLSDEAQIAITHIFGGDWEEASRAIMKLKTERNEQN